MFYRIVVSIAKFFWWIVIFIFKDIIMTEWKNRPWMVAAFFAPILGVILSFWGPFPGVLALGAYILGFVVIGLVRISLPIIYWPRSEGDYYTSHYGYAGQAASCNDAARGLFLGGAPAFILLVVGWANSPEMKAAQAQTEADHQEAIKSGTLMSRVEKPYTEYWEGVVVNHPERVGVGDLMVVRASMKNDYWSPRMLFISRVPGCELPKPGDQVKIRARFFRATENWHAKPGMDGRMVVYFVEPCK
jgi:hypothetical protein